MFGWLWLQMDKLDNFFAFLPSPPSPPLERQKNGIFKSFKNIWSYGQIQYVFTFTDVIIVIDSFCRLADHQILLAKLNHYGIHGVSNDWFKSCLSNCSQYVSINGYESSLAVVNCGVPQGSVVGPLLFLLYTNDLYKSSNKIL